MRRIVIDTNVLVSAMLSPKGNAAIILDMFENGLLEAVYCPEIIAEYESVLARPRFGFSHIVISDALDLFRVSGIPVNPNKSDFPMSDESDRVFYDTAVTGAAMLITGNMKHYPKHTFIVNPADFIKRR